MKRLGRALAIFALFSALGLAATFISYAALLLVLWFIWDQFEMTKDYPWAPLAGTAFVFLVALVTALRDRLPDITELRWDSGTVEDCPARSDFGKGLGRFWSLNPLGPRSVSSIGSVGAGLLGFDPSLFVAAITSAAEEWRGDPLAK